MRADDAVRARAADGDRLGRTPHRARDQRSDGHDRVARRARSCDARASARRWRRSCDARKRSRRADSSIGLPLDGNGDETPRSREVRLVAEAIGARSGKPVELVDERYTTATALRAVREMGGSTRGRKGDVDALAAAVLLQQGARSPKLGGPADRWTGGPMNADDERHLRARLDASRRAERRRGELSSRADRGTGPTCA